MTTLRLPPRPLRLVAVGAHPDDIEIGCGGTLMALHQRGAQTRSLVLTGTSDRVREAAAAATAFGVTEPPMFAGLPDTRLPSVWNTVKDELHALQGLVPRPDVIFAPSPDDAHQDHALLGRLVRTVWRGPAILHYEIPKWDGDLGRPNVYMPLSPELAHRKVELLNRCFPSQHPRDWWDDEFFLGLLRLRGAEAQSRYAEAFTSTKLVLELT